jgi:hypothetical protein
MLELAELPWHSRAKMFSHSLGQKETLRISERMAGMIPRTDIGRKTPGGKGKGSIAQQPLETFAIVGRFAHRGVQGKPAAVVPQLHLLLRNIVVSLHPKGDTFNCSAVGITLRRGQDSLAHW